MMLEDFKKVAVILFRRSDPHSWENRPGAVLVRLFMAFPEIDRKAVLDHLETVFSDDPFWHDRREAIEDAFLPCHLLAMGRDGKKLYWCGGDGWEEGIENALAYDSRDEAEEGGPQRWEEYKDKPIEIVEVPYPEWMKCKDAVE